MSSLLPINLRDLIAARGVESARIEFKAAWDDATSNGSAAQVLRTICAFANDIQNLNGGYIVIGVREQGGQAELPPRGIDPAVAGKAQRWIRGKCKERIDPEYQPVTSLELVEGAHVLVVWCPGSQNRPHRVREDLAQDAEYQYFVRINAETVRATGAMLSELMQLTAKVPFDDRRNYEATAADLQIALVREFLRDVRSGLLDEPDAGEVYRKLRLVQRANGHEVPINAALLLFTEDPEKWFAGARIEVAQFADDAGGNLIEEREFRGPIQHQLRACISHLRNLSTTLVEKSPTQPESGGWVSYPLAAIEEVLVNAIYHRGYDGVPDPTKVYLYPDRLEVISYPGPVPALQLAHFAAGARIPPVPARNRRIGDFLKSLRLAEARGTGVPRVFRAMRDNGSQPPTFDFDAARTYFRVTLPAHPDWVALSALRDAAHLRAVGQLDDAQRKLEDALRSHPHVSAIATELIRIHDERDDMEAAQRVYEEYLGHGSASGRTAVILAFARGLIARNLDGWARRVLDQLPGGLVAHAAVDAAIQEKRLARFERAHEFFERAGAVLDADVRGLHEFAQTKIKLAEQVAPTDEVAKQARDRLLREARDMLRRVIQLPAPDARTAWAWFNLHGVLRWLGAPLTERLDALQHACRLAPDERRFRDELQRVQREAT